jgi:superfamily II RNA helicase
MNMTPGADKDLADIFKQIGSPAPSPFVPDPFQVEAVEAIQTTDCLVTAPTGAGKTWIAETTARQFLERGLKIWYATPLKALTNSIHAQFTKLFGPDKVGILTGDIKENPNAPMIIGTTEILRNQLYDAMHTGKDLGADFIILDEAHFLGDEERGVVWEEIIIYLPVRIPLLMLSATIGNTGLIAEWLTAIRGKECRVVQAEERPVPLFPLFLNPTGQLSPLLGKSSGKKKITLHRGVAEYLKAKPRPQISQPGRLPDFSQILKVLNQFNLLPAIFFLKSRADCDHAIKSCTGEILAKDPQTKKRLALRIDELTRSNKHLARHSQRQILEHTAAGSHHSGQLPGWKVVVETLMAEGLLSAMFATSTVAAGVNFPARSVVILNSDRFNGTEFLPLTASEFQQMTGRAGRRGMDKIGFAVVIPGRFMDLNHSARMLTAPPLDVKSQIKINFSMTLNLLLSHTPEKIRLLLDNSFASHMITKGKRGNYARRAFGADLEHLWDHFMAHLDFLKQENFVSEDDTLTPDGEWAAQLRMDAPLLVAQTLRLGLLPERDPVMLAAVMASFVSEKEFEDESLERRMLPKRVIRQFLTLRKGLKPFAASLMDQGFDAPFLYLQPASVMLAWAGGEPWEATVKRTSFAEGDLARLILRTAENLRQLAGVRHTFPIIAATAIEAIELIRREPVVDGTETYEDEVEDQTENQKN